MMDLLSAYTHNTVNLQHTSERSRKEVEELENSIYKREGQSKERKSGDGADDVYTSKWIHLSQLHFLDAFETAKTSRSNLEVYMHALSTYIYTLESSKISYHVCFIIAMRIM